MSEVSSDLTPKQEKALSSLLSSPSLEHAAKTAGTTTVTLWRYLQDDAFKSAYRAARREVVNHAVTRLQQACSGAVDVLCAVATDQDAPAGARVTACRTILEIAFKAIEIDDLAARIDALEKANQ